MLITLTLLQSCGTYTERDYYDDGTLKSEYSMIDWKENGVGIRYYPNGVVKQKSNWINGVKNGPSSTYYKNGQTEIESVFRNGMQHGWATYYDSLGVLQSRTFYFDNIPDSFEVFYPNGDIRILGNYSDDTNNSEAYHYYETGDPYMYEVIKNGSLFYQKWYKPNGDLGATYLPLEVTFDSEFCVKLLHTQLPEDSILTRVYFQKTDIGVVYSSKNEIESLGLEVCTDQYKFTEPNIIEGYVTEIFIGDGANYGFMPFKYDVANKLLTTPYDDKLGVKTND